MISGEGVICTPGLSAGTSTTEYASSAAPSGAGSRTSVVKKSATGAFEMNDLRPDSTNSAPAVPAGRSVVVIALRSEPASGSVSASAANDSPEATRGSHARRCVSLPPRAMA